MNDSPVTTETPTPVAETAATPVPAPAAPAVTPREAIIAKYNSMYGERTPTEVTPSVVDDAPVVPAAVATPEPIPVPPVVPADAAPIVVTPTSSDVLLERMTALLEKQGAAIAAAEAREHARINPPPPPQEEPESQFIALLREGKVKEAQAALKEELLADIAKSTAKPVDPQILVENAIEAMRLDIEMRDFLTTVRSDNPDIVPMESYIASAVQVRMETAKAKGHLTSGPAYSTAYKNAVNDEVAKARKIIQLARAAGSTEARTTHSEVLSAATIVPQTVNVERGLSATGPAAPDVSATTYLQRRLAGSQAGKGL